MFTQNKSLCYATKLIAYFLILIQILILFQIQASPFFSSSSPSSASWAFFSQWKGKLCHANSSDDSTRLEIMASRLRTSVTFLPLKDLRFADTAMTANTWFMSSLNDTYEENEAEYMYFPSPESKGRLLCIMGNDTSDGTKNSYALAWPESLPESATLMEGLTFVSYIYYDYGNLWHGLCAMAPFVGWSMKNGCAKPTRWVLFHTGEQRNKMGSWLEHLMHGYFGEIKVEVFTDRVRPYCFEKAVVMRHEMGKMGLEKKRQVLDLLRCKAREVCGLNPSHKEKGIDENGVPIIRLTLLMRRGPRSFKNATAVIDIFARECAKVQGCILKIYQSDDLNFCDQVVNLFL